MRRAMIPAFLCGAAATALAGLAEAERGNLFRLLDAPTLDSARAAVQRALESRASGEAERWRVGGVASGHVVPLRTWQTTTGHWCREFTEHLVLADGRRQTVNGVHCRMPNGSWEPTGD